MGGYRPLYIRGNTTGLVQNRVESILPNDAYPILENAYLFRERIIRKQGCEILGRLQRQFTNLSLGNSGASPWSFDLFTTLSPNLASGPEAGAMIVPGSVVITMGGVTFTDQGNGTLTSPTMGNSGTILYFSPFTIVLTTTVAAGTPATVSFNYYPNLPVMGLRLRELNSISVQQTIAFDTVYSYNYVSPTGWQEFVPGTTWTGTDLDFFWTTNYWVDNPAAGSGNNNRIFWATNFSGPTGDPIRYTNGLSGNTWIDFAPQIDNAMPDPNLLTQCLALVPFRGNLVAFNTWEGPTLNNSINFPQRVRWAAIGTPFTTMSAIVPSTNINPNAWRDDIRGQGGFLNVPTTEEIVSVGFVRDNLVIYCERSTWQLRYTGRAISPYQIERVNSELGTESTFSAVQFDTSLVGIGDKGVVECDSFKSELIDIKIPDLVFGFNQANGGKQRIQGARDFVLRLAYWTYPIPVEEDSFQKYPNRRLVYNYENDSWAIFTDTFTALGPWQGATQTLSGRTWETAIPWQQCNFAWINSPPLVPAVVAGNQQGYVVILDQQTLNDPTLFISNITGNNAAATEITSPNHNLESNQIIQISGIPASTPFADSLNGKVFAVQVVDANNFTLYKYNPDDDEFNLPQQDSPATFAGVGQIAVRDNFFIQSKKFNFLEEGQNIQFGYLDILLNATSTGALSLYVYLNYDEYETVNTLPNNEVPSTGLPDPFFNVTIPTTNSTLTMSPGSKFWQRVYCPVRGNFVTIAYTLSNAQMAGLECGQDVQIEGQVLWMRPAGRLTNF